MTAWICGARAVVTGAGGGIGRAVSLALAQRGAAVAAVDVDGTAAEATADACGRGASAHEVDVRDRDSLARVRDELGPVDLLVNNAGVGLAGSLADMTPDDWEWIRSVNLDGAVHACAVFGPPMLARGRGHVVNVSSGLGYAPVGDMAAYCTTKAAVLMLSQCLRADWGPSGVGVSAVCPGVIDTPIVGRTRFVGALAAERERAERLFRRGHRPEIVAGAVVRAIERDRPLVTAGWEAGLGWALHRLAPLRVQQALARRGLG